MLMLVCSLCATTACSMQEQTPANEAQTQNYWVNLEKATCTVDITTNLGQSTLDYQLDYVYNKNDSDTFTITKPTILSGITASIASDETGTIILQYQGTALDAPSTSRIGATPADAVTALLYDLRMSSPTASWKETVDQVNCDVLKYEHVEEDGVIMRQIWLSEHQPKRAEIYVDGECVLMLVFHTWI